MDSKLNIYEYSISRMFIKEYMKRMLLTIDKELKDPFTVESFGQAYQRSEYQKGEYLEFIGGE